MLQRDAQASLIQQSCEIHAVIGIVAFFFFSIYSATVVYFIPSILFLVFYLSINGATVLDFICEIHEVIGLVSFFFSIHGATERCSGVISTTKS